MAPTSQDNSASSRGWHSSRQTHNRRPATIAELADDARDTAWDPTLSLKHWLKTAEMHRKAGNAYIDKSDLEPGFVELARAATIVMEKVPTHKDYQTLLNPTLRANLGTNGQEMLDKLGLLKGRLIDRYEQWAAHYPEEAARVAAGVAPLPSTPRPSRSQDDDQQRRSDERRRDDERRQYEQDARYRRVEDDRRQTDHRRRTELREQEQRSFRDTTEADNAKLRDAMSAVRLAADGAPLGSRRQDDSRPSRATIQKQEDVRRQQEDVRRQQEDVRWQQEEMKRREEEIVRRKTEERRKQERDGIAQRQQEAEAAIRTVRYPQNSLQQLPAPTAVKPTSFDVSPRTLLMPLESPTGDDVSDSETFKPSRYLGSNPDTSHRNPYPPPITTTSPPPPQGHIQYPMLMTKHQMTQGYAPSLASMFNGNMKASNLPQSLLFVPDPASAPPSSSSYLYPQNMLPQPTMPSSRATSPSYQQAQSFPHPYGPSTPQPPGSFPPRASRQMPVTPATTNDPRPSDSRITRAVSKSDAIPDLKTVSLPRDCLPRFLAIAALNTALNRETCGLLLGKDKGHKFLVTTLLIPKQHSTSDTCTMDEEELVLRFTEERNLITLGWIHTHPSQSCFMSSVDLHTHSGFQKMLPESFAVVCAPKSTPNFGIFRLTDPPGLQTVLDCTVKAAFHPHPDKPIYTDADKGHVSMKDAPLEIVDLR